MIHLLLSHHAVEISYKDAFIMFYHTILVDIYAFAISYVICMHLGSTEEITLLEFDEVEEGDQQEIPQVAAPEGEEQNPEELLECPDHRPTSFLKGKPRSILSLPWFYKILLESLMIDALGYKSCLKPLDAYNFLVQKYTFNPM